MRRQQRNRDGDKPGGDERGDRQRHGQGLVLPALTLALPLAGFLGQVTRDEFSSAMEQPFAVSARARGMSDFGVRWRHAIAVAIGSAAGYAWMVRGQPARAVWRAHQTGEAEASARTVRRPAPACAHRVGDRARPAAATSRSTRAATGSVWQR
jgi:hypothetical protein